MNWYNFFKFLHIVAVIVMIGGIFARQLVRAIIKKSDDPKAIASLTQVVGRLDRAMVIPGSNLVIVCLRRHCGVDVEVAHFWFFAGRIPELVVAFQYPARCCDAHDPYCISAPQQESGVFVAGGAHGRTRHPGTARDTQ